LTLLSIAPFVGFLLILAPLVVVHEMGHFLFAKLFNVKAEAFSVGFGPVLARWRWGETDFRVSAIPLGGYVKLLGEDPTRELTDAERRRALHMQPPWKRFFIFFGGPLFNFLWAALVFMVMMAIGEPQVASVIGRVIPGSPAAEAGLIAGDRVTAVNGESIQKFEDLVHKVSDHPNSKVGLRVIRDQQNLELVVQTNSEDGYSVYGEERQVGAIDGIFASGRGLKLGISDPNSTAGKAGIVTGDTLVRAGDFKPKDWEDLERQWPKLIAGKRDVELELLTSENSKKTVVLKLSKTKNPNDLGIFASELFIDKVMPDSPAERAMVKAGDRVVAVDGKELQSFLDMRLSIQKGGESAGKVNVLIARGGEQKVFEISPNATAERDPTLKKRMQYTIGVMPVVSIVEPEMIVERISNPLLLAFRGFERMLDLSWKNLVSIGKMFVGEVSVKSLGGPILIGKLAGDSLSRGLMDFLRMMAILSIGLGVLNILPVPVLDGGHILLLGLEVVRGKALSMKQIEVVQKVGFAAIMALMVIVMRNDLSRLPIFN
jgi:regulator of sigma E protease